LDDMGVSKLSAKVFFFKVNYFKYQLVLSNISSINHLIMSNLLYPEIQHLVTHEIELVDCAESLVEVKGSV